MSKKKIGRFVGYGLLYIGLLLFGFVAVMPFIWMVRSSFMEIKQIFIMPPQWIPDPFTLDNYAAWRAGSFHFLHGRPRSASCHGNGAFGKSGVPLTHFQRIVSSACIVTPPFSPAACAR